MNRPSYDLFLALVALGSIAVLVGALVLAVTRLVTGSIPDAVRPLVDTARRSARPFAFAAAAGATAGSLVYSEVYGLRPCQLCWVQRGFMYPAAVLLGLSLLGRDAPWATWAARLAGLLAVGGLGVSIWHRYEQAVGASVGVECALDNPCFAKYVEEFGFVTIPTMAGIGFALVVLFVLLDPRSALRPATTPDPRPRTVTP